MTHEEHKQVHIVLHRHFDELLADYLMHHRDALPSKMNFIDFLKWSHQQTLDPTELPGEPRSQPSPHSASEAETSN